jgi:hypothetical protein
MSQREVLLPLEEIIFWPGRTVWLGLVTGENGREVSGTGYARQPVVFTRDERGQVHLPERVSFGPASADWPPVWGIALYHQPQYGEVVYRHALWDGATHAPPPGGTVDVDRGAVRYVPPVRDEERLVAGLEALLALLREPGDDLALGVTAPDGRHIPIPPDVVRHLTVSGHGLPGSVRALLDEAVRRELGVRLWRRTDD